MENKKGIVRINAGAGAGKTLTVVMRVIKLLLAGVKPEEILLISFTATAAAEMRDRITLYAEDFGIDADISHNESLFQFLIEVVVNTGISGKDIIYAFNYAIPGFG